MFARSFTTLGSQTAQTAPHLGASYVGRVLRRWVVNRGKSCSVHEESSGCREESEVLECTRQLQVQFTEAGFVSGFYRNVGILVWGKAATGPLVARLRANTLAYSKDYKRFSAVNVVVNGAGLPAADVREQLISFQHDFSDKIVCVAQLLVGSGFWAGAVRGFLTGLHCLRPTPFRIEICSSVPQVVDWLVPFHGRITGVQLPPADLRNAILEAMAHPALKAAMGGSTGIDA